VYRTGAVAALIGAGEGPVVATHGDEANLPLGRTVGHAQPAIVEEARECHPSGEAIGDGLGDLALPRELGALFALPSLQCDDERTAALVAHLQALLRRETVDLALDREQASMRSAASMAIGALSSRAKSKNWRRACAQRAASMMGPPLRPAP
jgi:hypothetical protein